MKHTLNRRHFLKGALVTAGAAAFGGLGALSRLAQAQGVPAVPERHYIFCYFSGGWDILLGLDPRDPAVFTSRNLRTTQILPGYDQLRSGDGLLRTTPQQGHIFGPHIGPLAGLVDRGLVTVMRGLSMDTLTHEVGRRRFLTGKPPAGLQARGSASGVWLASHLGQGEPIPNLSLQVESYNKDQPTYASALRVNSVADLLRALRPQAPQLSFHAAQQLAQHQRDLAQCTQARNSTFWQAAEAARGKAQEMVSSQLDSLFDFAARTPEMEALRDHYDFDRVDTSPKVQAAFAAQAIMGGVSRCVSIQVASGLDTHFDDWSLDQGPRQEVGFDAVARLIEDLARKPYHDTGDSWLDHTVVVGFSEFSRTSFINDRGGRDHSLTNACFLAGGGIRGGQVLGRTSDTGLTPTKMDLMTGRPSQDGEVIRPEHILRTLYEEVGIGDAPDLRVSPIQALMKG